MVSQTHHSGNRNRNFVGNFGHSFGISDGLIKRFVESDLPQPIELEFQAS